MVFAVDAASAQIVVDQCDTMEFSVTSRPSIDDTHFVWAIYNSSPNPTDILDPAGAIDPAVMFVDGMYAGRTVQVLGLNAGKYYVRINVWDEITCTDNVEMYVLEVIENLPEAELVGDSACIGEPTYLKIIFSGTAPFDVKYTFGDGTTVVNLNGITEMERTIALDPFPVGETKFWIMEVTDNCTVHSYESDPQKVGVLIYPKPKNSKIYLKE